MRRLLPLSIGLLFLGTACTPSGSSGPIAGTGGISAGTGGVSSGAGGNAAGTGGAAVGSGGLPGGTGGVSVGSGGVLGGGTGGSLSGTGGGATGGTGPAGTGGTGPMGTGGTGPGGTGGRGPAGAGGAGPNVPCQAPIAVTGTAATVTVSLGTTLAPVSPDLLGLHTAAYSAPLTTAGLPAALSAAGVGSLRYPGGSYGDVYFWDIYGAYTASPAQGFGSNSISLNPGNDFGNFVRLLQNSGAKGFITVNYGSRPFGTAGPGVPQEAAAWVAYANALPTSTVPIGLDASGHDWGTAGDWARLRASAPLATDTNPPTNFLRINHPDPVGIKYWEIGNEVFGNGFYQAGQCWENDLHVPYVGTACAGRQGAAALSPTTYGAAVATYSRLMKMVDSTIKVGAVLNWTVNAYANWDTTVLQQSCETIDFIVTHWYGGTSIADLLTRPHADIPTMFRDLHALITPANGCTTKTAATIPIAVTEWGPNQGGAGAATIGTAFNPGGASAPKSIASQTHTQAAGVFVAETFANLMDQGGISAHLAEMYPASSGIAFLDAANTPTWGYHAVQITHALTGGGGSAVQATSSLASVIPHATLRADGGVAVMLTNTSATAAASVTVNVMGGTSTLACAGFRTAYSPAAGSTDLDGPVSAAQTIFSTPDGTSVPVGVPPYSIVVVTFPKR